MLTKDRHVFHKDGTGLFISESLVPSLPVTGVHEPCPASMFVCTGLPGWALLPVSTEQAHGRGQEDPWTRSQGLVVCGSPGETFTAQPQGVFLPGVLLPSILPALSGPHPLPPTFPIHKQHTPYPIMHPSACILFSSIRQTPTPLKPHLIPSLPGGIPRLPQPQSCRPGDAVLSKHLDYQCY